MRHSADSNRSWSTVGFARRETATDRRVMAALTAVGTGQSTITMPVMRPLFRDELRRQLVAVTPRLVEESANPTDASPASVRSRRLRPATAAVGVAAVVLAGFGGTAIAAQNAVPGDVLYGLKRGAESVDVAFATNDVEAGHAQLVDAQTRVEEVSSLLDRPQAMALAGGSTAGSQVSDRTAALVVDTLRSADDSTRSGVSAIADDAVAHDHRDGLDLVVAWAPGQRDRIDALVERLGADDSSGDEDAGSAAAQARTAAAEIRAAYDRAADLLAQLGHSCASRGHDGFGPLPCLTGSAATAHPSTSPSIPAGVPSAGTGSGSTTPGSASAPGTSGAPSVSSSQGQGGTGGGSRSGGSRSGGSGSTPGTVPQTSAPSLPSVPGLPLPTSMLPSAVGSLVPSGVTSVLPSAVGSLLPTSVGGVTSGSSLPVTVSGCVQLGAVQLGTCPTP